MKVNIGKDQFGPWALITGASSGIGQEFARQLAEAAARPEHVQRLVRIELSCAPRGHGGSFGKKAAGPLATREPAPYTLTVPNGT
jgi:hypothetical protein